MSQSSEKPQNQSVESTQQSPMQLALPVTLPDDELFESFYQGDNEQVLEHMQQVLADDLDNKQDEFRFTYLSGPEKSGKSHLLYACCVKAQELGLSNMLLPLDQLVQMKPQVLDGIEHYDLVCIDNFEQIAGIDAWERALFYLFNLLDAGGKTLVVAANELPANLNIKLPDLVSRLNWGTTFQLKMLSDDDKVKALQMRAKLRGLELSQDAGRFMVTRLTRDICSLIEALDKLDKASIAMQRKLTIPFIKGTLDL